MSTYCVLPNLLLYGAAALLAVLERWRSQPRVRRWSLRLFGFGILLHTVYLLFLFKWLGFPFLWSRGILLGVLAWTCAVAYLVLARGARWQYVSGYFLPIVFILFLQSVARGPEYELVHMILPVRWAVPLHLTFAAVSMGLCLAASLISVILLRTGHRLKSRRPDPEMLRFPTLPAFEGALTRLLLGAFAALTCTLATGIVLTAWTTAGVPEPLAHQGAALIGWMLYAALLASRWLERWPGRRGALLACLGFLILLFSFVEVHSA